MQGHGADCRARRGRGVLRHVDEGRPQLCRGTRSPSDGGRLRWLPGRYRADRSRHAPVGSHKPGMHGLGRHRRGRPGHGGGACHGSELLGKHHVVRGRRLRQRGSFDGGVCGRSSVWGRRSSGASGACHGSAYLFQMGEHFQLHHRRHRGACGSRCRRRQRRRPHDCLGGADVPGGIRANGLAQALQRCGERPLVGSGPPHRGGFD
mmetsp:Transcript_34613/g.99724  ORF Transcript_34613/g.99724 Transcript_34613/m.99724 type:complete len:206 (+) Transcript_34613:418-1035(+)